MTVWTKAFSSRFLCERAIRVSDFSFGWNFGWKFVYSRILAFAYRLGWRWCFMSLLLLHTIDEAKTLLFPPYLNVINGLKVSLVWFMWFYHGWVGITSLLRLIFASSANSDIFHMNSIQIDCGWFTFSRIMNSLQTRVTA